MSKSIPSANRRHALISIFNDISKKQLVKSLIVVSALLYQNEVSAQSLTFSNSGQTGTSGTNWTTSGTNPVSINITGAATINTSVIQGYLNSGISVVAINSGPVGTIINSNISKTGGGNAALTIKDRGCIRIASGISVNSSSNALDVILWADSDGSQGGAVMDFLYLNAGTTISTNGGKIVLAGGFDDGGNGGVSGDGIPDGFAWNGANVTDQGANEVGGLTLGPRGGVGTVVSLLSGGGDIILRGATSNNNSYPGVTSQGNLKIVSGIGKIIMSGKSTTGHGVELTYGAAPAIVFSSSATASPAIDVKGITTASGFHGFWSSNNVSGNILIQSLAATNGGISVEGTNSAGTGLSFGTGGTNITTQILSQSGTIALSGLGNLNNSLWLQGDVYFGNRKDATVVQGETPSVTASAANVIIRANDQSSFTNAAGKTTNFNTTGAFTMEAYSNGYSGTISWNGNPVFGSGFSGVTLGEAAENYSFVVNNSIAAAGNITAHTSQFTLANGVGLSSSVAGDININAKGSFNTAGTTRRTISSTNGNINIFADSDASGDGQLDIDYLTFNPGSGTTTLRTETMSWTTALNTDKPYFNGTGSVIIEPSDASFQNVGTSGFVFDQDANGMSGLRIGKPTNNGNVTIETTPLTVAGSIALYGGVVTLNVNLTSSATGDIFIKSNSTTGASISPNASIFKTAGTGTLTMQSQARLNSGTITASGTGRLNVILWSDYGHNDNGGVRIDAVTTNGGHIWIGGSNFNGGSATWNGLTVGNGPSVGAVNNNHNAMDFYGPVITNGGDVAIWGGNGYSGGATGMGIYPGASINAGSGDITIMADNISLNDLTIETTGHLSLLPDGGSYPANITWSGVMSGSNFNATGTYDALVINNFANLGGLTIGYYDQMFESGVPLVMKNSSGITFNSAASIAGPIKLFGNALAVNANVASTNGSEVSFVGNTLALGAAVTVASSGVLSIEPVTPATTIGLAGGAGTLAVSTYNLATNFIDGFSEIRIGNDVAGNITLGTATSPKDHWRLTTAGNLLLNETVDIGTNDLRFSGAAIVPATDKFVKTTGAGKLIMNLDNSAGKLFPIGVTNYSPVTITNHTGLIDEFYATASALIYKNGTTSGEEVSWSPKINVTWNIGNSAGSTGAGNVELAFGWSAADVTGVFVAPRLFHHNGSHWQEQTGITSVNLGARKLNYAAYSGSFSPFAITEANMLLPVSWLSFAGQRAGDKVDLSWSTAANQQNSHFEIQRGTSSAAFEAIGRVTASQVAAVNKYDFADHQPLSGVSYYRVKQVDFNGEVTYSKTISIAAAVSAGYRVAMISGSQQLMVTTPQQLKSGASIVVFDGAGRQLLQQKLKAGLNIISTGSLLRGGVYFVSVVEEKRQVYSDSFVY